MEEVKKQKKVKVRGTGTFDPSDNSFDFTPFNEAPSTQTQVKTCVHGGKTWLTTGTAPLRMVCLKCKASSPDQYDDLVTQFNALTKDLRPKKPVQMPDRLRVVAEGGLECWLNEAKSEVTFTGVINLDKHCRDWQAETLRLVQLVVRRLPASERFNKIISLIKRKEDKK